jgi:signal transduction histidine kinase
MEKTAARMMRQVQNIMRYSELLATSPRLESLALEEVLRSVRQALVEHHGVKTDQITWGPLGQVRGDPRDLTLLFEAILSNAFTYAHPDRNANVRVQRVDGDTPDQVKIIISDNGRGIPAQHIEAVLDLFSRLHTYADIPGTGLGLALCRRVMERHNGTIQLSSDLGRGTNVTLCFPKGETR